MVMTSGFLSERGDDLASDVSYLQTHNSLPFSTYHSTQIPVYVPTHTFICDFTHTSVHRHFNTPKYIPTSILTHPYTLSPAEPFPRPYVHTPCMYVYTLH